MKKLNRNDLVHLEGGTLADGFCGTVTTGAVALAEYPPVAAAIGFWGWVAIGVSLAGCAAYYTYSSPSK